MKYIISIPLIIVPILIALISSIIEKKKCHRKLSFANEFLTLFHNYVNSSGSDTESYISMTKHSNRMQNQLGGQGLMTLQQPFNRGIINNYTIILSGLPQIQSYLLKDILRDQAVQLARYVVDALLRNIGDNENQINEINSSLKNPIIIYKLGWNRIISIPFMTLYWLGIFTENALNFVTNNFIFKIIVGIVALVGLISSIMTIVLGFDEFLIIIKELFYRI